MSDRFARATDAPLTVTLAGREWRVHKLRPRDLGEIEAWMESQVPDPRIAAAERVKDPALPETIAKHIWDRACEEASENWPPTVGSPQALRLLASAEGQARIVYVLLRRGQPGFTIDDARALADELSDEEIDMLMKTASPGDPAAPKSQAPTAGAEPTKKSGRRSRSNTGGRSRRSTT